MCRRANRRRLAVALALAVLGGACGGGDGPPEARDKPAKPDDATAVVEQFVEAVEEADFERAMDLQCSAARVPDESRELWLSQLQRFHDEAGSVTDAAATATRGTGMQPAADLPDVVEVSYTLTIKGEEHEPLLAATVIENGERRVCGRATRAAKQLFADFSELPPAGPDATATPRELLPTEPPAGHHQVEDKAAEPLKDSQSGELDGWTRAWQRSDYGARATAVRFDTDQHAREAAGYYLSKKAADSVESIALPDQPYARGTRLLGLVWLGIQPPDLGPYVDYVYAVFGRTMVVVAATVPTSSDHSLAEGLLKSVEANVTP